MDPGMLVRLIVYAPIVAGGGVYCWRHGIRWTKDVTIKGLPGRIAAVFCFALAAVMLFSAIFPSQAERLADSLDQAMGGRPTKHVSE